MANPNLILLEDEQILREELAEFITSIGYQVCAVADLADFRANYDALSHRIAVIDLGLPDGDGMDLIRTLRAQGQRIGIVVLTARGGMPDKIVGLSDGADYYLEKSTDLDELAATLLALQRRLGSTDNTERWILELGPRRLLAPGCPPIPLSQQDVTVLHTLMAEQGKTVSRQKIITSLGENFLEYDQRRLDTQIRRLRRKAEQSTHLTLPISTARNLGYQFYAETEIRP